MEDLSHFCCQNTGCSMYGARNSNNLTVSKTYGKAEDIRLLRCSICKARFSERRGTPYFNSRMPKRVSEKILPPALPTSKHYLIETCSNWQLANILNQIYPKWIQKPKL